MFWFFVFITFLGLGLIIYFYLIESGRISKFSLSRFFRRLKRKIKPPRAKKSIIFLLGPPCGGKGTLCDRISKDRHFDIISPGNSIRRATENSDYNGKMLRECLSQGKLVPDEVVMSVLKEDIKSKINNEHSKSIVFDGMPRTISQAKILWKELNRKDFDFDFSFKLVLLDCPEEDLLSRVAKRLVCSNKKCQKTYSKDLDNLTIDSSCKACDAKLVFRLDDNLETLQKRIKFYCDTVKEIRTFLEGCSVKVSSVFAGNSASPNLVYMTFVDVVSDYDDDYLEN